MLNTDVAYIIGHPNPDMDSIAAALGYAWALATRDSEINTQRWKCSA